MPWLETQNKDVIIFFILSLFSYTLRNRMNFLYGWGVFAPNLTTTIAFKTDGDHIQFK